MLDGVNQVKRCFKLGNRKAMQFKDLKDEMQIILFFTLFYVIENCQTAKKQ